MNCGRLTLFCVETTGVDSPSNNDPSFVKTARSVEFIIVKMVFLFHRSGLLVVICYTKEKVLNLWRLSREFSCLVNILRVSYIL